MRDLFHLLRLNRLTFVAWGWATLLVIFVSAAPDGGAPGSRALGSAFDPATVTVTTGRQAPRSPSVARIDKPAPPALSSSGADSLAVAARSLHAAPPVLVAGSSPALRLEIILDPRASSRAHGARAPPNA